MVIGLVNGHILFAIYPNIYPNMYPNIYPESLSLLLENFWQLVRKRYMLGYMLQNIYRFQIPITIGTYSHSGVYVSEKCLVA